MLPRVWPAAEALLDLLPELVLLVETDGTILSGNAALRRALRLDGAALEGRSLYDLIDTPAERAAGYLRRCAGSLQTLPGVLAFRGADGTSLECRCDGARLRQPDGAAGPVLLRCRRKADGSSGFSLLNQKIADLTREVAARRMAESALRDSERQFRVLADAIPQLIWMAHPDGSIFWYNRRWYEYTGTTAAETKGWGWQSVHDPEMLPTVLERWRAAIARGEPLEMVFPLRGADGVFRPFLTRVEPLRGEDGRVVRWFGTNTDISAQREAEETLRRLNDILEQRVAAETGRRREAEEALRHAQKLEAIGQLAGGVAHDFNNLLQVIIGNLDSLRRRAVAAQGHLAPTELDRLVAGAMRGAERAATLTQRLLAFGRRQPLAAKPVDPNKVVAGLSELLRRTLGESITIETVLAGGLWRVMTDADQLESAILNLAVNARDAMAEGGLLTIETANTRLDESYAARHQEVAAGDYVMVAVTDTGAGMDKDVVARAFDPFFTTKEVGKGSGLGLSQVYGFAKQSGGHVKIYSEPGEGATVRLYLPRLAPCDAQHDEAVAAVELPAPQGGELVLLVEDDPDVRASTADMLRQLGYRVIEAADAAAALRQIEAAPEIRLLFTDVGLPGGMNGRQLAEEALRRRPSLKVLYATGYARNAIVHQGRLDAGVELIVKPFGFASLAAKLRQMFGE